MANSYKFKLIVILYATQVFGEVQIN